MKKIWQIISNVGLRDDYSEYDKRQVLLSNRLNFILTSIFIAVFCIDFAVTYPVTGKLSISLYKFLLLVVLGAFCFFLNLNQRFRLAHFLLIIFIPFILIIFPTILGDVTDEYFFWYPFVPAAISIMPYLLLSYKRDKLLIIASITWYFLMVLFIDSLLIRYSDADLKIVPIVGANILFFKVSHVTIFLFLNAVYFYLFSLTNQYQDSLKEFNTKLTKQRADLFNHNEELITQREELAEKNQKLDATLTNLKKAQAKLVQSEKMASLGTLTAGIAHEINNPLNFTSGSLQLIKAILDEYPVKFKNLKEEKQEQQLAEVYELLKHAFTGVDNVSCIIKSLMSFSYRNESFLSKANINKIIDSTVLVFKSRIPAHVDLVMKFKDDIPEIMCFQDKLQQVILSIIDNAVDAISLKENSAKEKIEIRTSSELFIGTENIYISIMNSGPAIPDEELAKIFDPFFTTKTPEKGTGLGLSEAYAIINEHNGDIKVFNHPGMVEFLIRLPQQ